MKTENMEITRNMNCKNLAERQQSFLNLYLAYDITLQFVQFLGMSWLGTLNNSALKNCEKKRFCKICFL